MKGKRYTTEDKIRILREADTGKSILEVCREHNLSETSFHRWKHQFGQMEISDARRLKGAGAREQRAKEDARREPAQKPGLGGGMRKKIVSPAHRKELAHTVVEAKLCSGRAACRFLQLSRSTFWYRARPPSARQGRMIKRLHELAAMHPRYGYRRMAALLRQEGWSVGKRQIQRLRRNEGLRVPSTKRRVMRRGASTGLPTKATRRGHVWTWDFVSNATVRGGAIRMLTILDGQSTRTQQAVRRPRGR